MRRAQFVLLAFVAALLAVAATAGSASAATVTVDSRDGAGGNRWEPANVTIDAGDEVVWEFDATNTLPHNVKSSSPNWTYDGAIKNPGDAADEFTFDAPGVYTYVCSLHPEMTGSVTVEGDEPADHLQQVLVFSKTAGFRHDSIPAGIAAIQQLGVDNGFDVDVTEDGASFTDANLAQYDVVVFLSTTGDVLTDQQQAAFERYIQAGHGYAGIHSATDTEYGWKWYGEMTGAYFRNHPAGTPTATVKIEDGDEPSTTGLPASWSRVDEWYNFQSPTNPVVNGGGTDYSPRASVGKVLATVDETTYGEDDGNATDDDHPIAWCSDFDGGNAWYTAMGHTQASFSEAAFLDHLLGGLETAAGAPADCGAPRFPTPSASDFEKVTVDDDTQNPMELDVANDGRVFYIERDGRVMVWQPGSGQTSLVGTIPVTQSQENGLLGIQLANDFDSTGHVYLAYSALPDSSNQNRLSRFTVQNNAFVAGSEQIIYTWQHQRAECCHTAGSIAMAPDGSIYIATGDNTNPFDSNGFTPIDERAGRQAWDAQRTSANTNDPNGKILHIIPKPDAAGAPGIGTTYEIPAGNLFPEAQDTQNKTLPEIYGMGFRNPFRITVDPKTGWVLMGDYGPDAGSTNPNRGPQGSVEYNVVKQAGFYGWPYCIRQNVPYNDYNFATSTSGPKFNCDAPVNDSPNNTGLTNLPPAIPATMWMGYGETDTRFPLLGTGGAPTGGPRYDYDPDSDSLTKFPAAFDGKWFIGEWNNGWIKQATLNANGDATDVQCWVACTNQFPGGGYRRPHEMEFGPDGSLYVIEWGSGFGGNNADSGIYRIDYTKGARKPIARASATPDSGPLPLQVQFSADGSVDPEGTSLTYEWDFDGNGTTDSTDADPVHTYTTPGTFQARLTVTDASGLTGTDTVPIIAGNSVPEVDLILPENGKVGDFGDLIPYEIEVTDAEDGSTGDGSIDCADVTLNVSLGHDEHAHELSELQGCAGTFRTNTDGGHGAEANVFLVVEATYTDRGASGGVAAVTGRAEASLQPRLKQAEFFTATGRTADGRGTDAAGVQTETTTDAGGGQTTGFIQDGDWISFSPYNLEDLDSVTYRVASGGAGGTIEMRLDAPDGELVVATPTIAPTGGWQNYTDVTVDLPDDVAEGEHTLYLVFRHPTSTGYLLNLNWFRFAGQGAAVSAPPTVTATATPTNGTAPLDVAFDSTASDAEGEALTYEWDFGVPGSDDTSAAADPTFTYERAGTYTARVTVTDASGQRASTSVQITVTGAGQCPTDDLVDGFDGTQLGADWTVIRPDQLLSVSDGALRIPAQAGDIYGTGGDAKNLVVREAPDGAWSATTKINFVGSAQYHQAGLMVYGDDDNFTKLGRVTTNTAGSTHAEKFEFIYEDAGTPRNQAADATANLAADFPADYYLRIESDGTNITGAYSTDGATWTPVGRAAALPADAKIGLFSFANAGAGNPVAAFDSFTLAGAGVTGGGSTGTSRDDQFDGTALDKDRWDAIVSDVPAEYAVGGGELTVTTSLGDIYTADTNPAPNNFLLQDASNAGADWVIETKVSGTTITGGYSQGGLMARVDGDNYVKLDVISDVNQTRLNRIELRSEVAGAVQNPQQNVTLTAEQAAGDIWLRLTKAGTSYSGEYSFDGATWTAFPGGAVPNAMTAPDFGLFAFSPQAAGLGETVSFDYFLLDGEDPPMECECKSPGDEFDAAELDKERWNAIVREDPANYVVSDGALRITTVGGDIYTTSDPATTRNFILQEPPVGDWTIETRVSGTMSGGYEHGGLLVRQDDDNYVKFDVISDQNQTIKNRIELRSEVAGAIVNPQPQVTRAAPGYDAVHLRLTKTGTSYSGEWSEDGETWTSIGQPVANPMEDPDFGLFTLGVNSPGGVVAFDYFAVNGETGCDGGGEENTAPVVGDVTASPTIGVGPLEVDFTADATDADGDDLSYAWDFQDDGTVDATEANPTFTYNAPGSKTARVTVSDGEDEATKTVSVQVLAADDPEAAFRVLVFSKTAGFRHSSIDEGIAAIHSLGAEHGFQVDATEDASAFRAGVLDHFDTVVWLSTTGDVLNDAQQSAFEDYVQSGGGYTGIHSAADTEYGWNWYGHLVGGYFRNHPPGTPTATVNVEDTDHPSTGGLPETWTRVDEWYNYQAPDNPVVNGGGDDYSVRDSGVHVLATVDESTYDEQDGNATDDDHPISWCQRYDGGRAWYTGMGHTEASFADADYLAHVLGGLRVSAGVVEDAACGIEPDTDALDVTAYADPTSGTAPLQVSFTAGVGVPHAGGLQYEWTFPGGDKAYGASVTTTFTTAGTKTVELRVTDAAGAVGTDTVEVTVAPAADLPPTIVEAEADVTEGTAPLEVWFHAVANDPEGKPLVYRWDFGDGGSALGDEAEHTYEESGTYTATLTVTDQAGQTDTRTFTITATDPPGNRPPSVDAAALPASGTAPLAVLFTAAGTDPDGDSLTYKWEFGDGTTGSGRRARHTYTANGTYTAKVTATDPSGATATDTVQVVVGNPAGNQAPTVQVAASKTAGKAPLAVQLTAAGSDPDGDQLSYVWSFGDGGAAAGTKVNHVYTAPGTYTATVTVTDAGGLSGSSSVTITVTAAASANGAPSPAAAAPSLAALTTKGAKLSVGCTVTGKVKVHLRVSKRLARKLGLERRRIAAAKARCVAGRDVVVRVKAGRKARRALKRKAPRSLRVAVSVTRGGVKHRDGLVTFR